MTQLEDALRELADVRAGIAFHKHTAKDGTAWRCSSPYCPPETTAGGAVFDGPPVGAPGSSLSTESYRRGDA